MAHLYDFLKRFTCQDVIKGESKYNIVLVAQHSDSIKTTCDILTDKKIHAMPVQGPKGDIIGMIDYLDMVTFLVSKFPTDKKDLNDVKLLDAAYQETITAKVTDVANFSGRNPYQALAYDAHVTKVVPLFAQGYHRVALSDEKNELVMTISQSTFLKWMAGYLENESIGKKTIEELGLGQVKPITIKDDDFVLDALIAMDKQKVNAVGIVRDDGKICGHFSSSDVRGFSKDNLPTFTLDAKVWLESHSAKSLHVKTVKPWTSLAELAKTLSHGVHSVWVVDEEGRPTGIVSQTDVCAALEKLM
jgi:CBS-domain-containing membrane protein